MIALVLAAIAGLTSIEEPSEVLAELLRTYHREPAGLVNRPLDAGLAGGEFLAFAKRHPRTPEAAKALSWVASRCLFTPVGIEAMKQFALDHPASSEADELVALLDLYYGESVDGLEDVFRAVLDQHGDHAVRGRACLALARTKIKEKETIETQIQSDELRKRGIGGPIRIPSPDPQRRIARLMGDGLILLDRVELEFSDVRKGDQTLGVLASEAKTRLLQLGIDQHAPEIEGVDQAGMPFKLSEYSGRIVLLVFSASWCGPCVAFYPEQKALSAEFAGEPFAVLNVNADEDLEMLRESIAKETITWRCWLDGGDGAGPICSRWNTHSFPQTFLIDRKGVIRLHNPPVGVGQWAKVIRSYRDEPPKAD